MATNYELTWTPSSDAHEGEYVYRSTTSSPSFPADYTLLTVLPPNTGRFTVRQAPSSTTQWAITSWNYNGTSIDESQPLIISASSPPAAPSGLTATVQ